ncbi:MAPK regulated corepressor interacting protein 2-like isoform X2 [Dreissena polymorpha]|uniref:Uncharacterized protein n=1 Tax=Dreissena polymorpha TaxID=45954 RepID=A0A9D4LRP2_DREPO|nr:MAPK regulated corepressor interacting protein 2-like isoform X2 [Dreissena polymorpha]KAH3863722.1 hypothetical protein DPMN_026711 [Dreissena polymorpha]
MGRGMYALPSKPSKIAAYARIVPSKTLNNLEVARESDKQQPALVMSSPKPVFNGNGQRSRYINNVRSNSTPSPPQFSPQHEEFVKYLSDSWNRVSRELENRTGRDGAYHYNVLRHRQASSGPTLYREKNPNPKLNDFKAFDLDKFWGERFLHQATSATS